MIKLAFNAEFYILNLKLYVYYLDIMIKRNRYINIIYLNYKIYIIYFFNYFNY